MKEKLILKKFRIMIYLEDTQQKQRSKGTRIGKTPPTNKGTTGEIKYPDEDETKEQENYIKKFLNKLE